MRFPDMNSIKFNKCCSYSRYIIIIGYYRCSYHSYTVLSIYLRNLLYRYSRYCLKYNIIDKLRITVVIL